MASQHLLPDPLAPVLESERIVSLDVLRGVAVLGILVLNIQSFAMVGSAYMNPTSYGSLDGINGWVWRLTHVLGDQKFMAIFSMLFGAGIVLMTTRSEKAGYAPARLHYRRMGWLILFGLLHALLLWYGDVLYTYGMCGLVLFLLRNLPPKWLFILAFVCLAVASGINVAIGFSMEAWGQEDVQKFSDETWLPTSQVVQAELATYRGGWLEQLPHRSSRALFFETYLFAIGGIGLKAAAMMLTGMGLFKLGVLSAAHTVRTYALIAAIGIGVGLPIVEFGVRQHIAHDWNVRYSFFFGTQYHFWASAVVAVGYVVLVMRVLKFSVTSSAVRLSQRPLSAVGRMCGSNCFVQRAM